MKRQMISPQIRHLQSYLSTILTPSKETTFNIRKYNSRKDVSTSKIEKNPRIQSKTLSFNPTICLEEVTASSWIAIDLETNKSMGYKINAEKEIASLTKIMTCIVALQHIQKYKMDKDIKIKVSKTAAMLKGTSANLIQDSWINLYDLVYGLMLPSGNDAAWLIAQVFGLLLYYEKFKNKETLYEDIESIDLSIYDSTQNFITHFIKVMNKKAKSLSMSNTNFSNPHGLVDSTNYSSVKDLSILCRYCLKNATFTDIVNTKSYCYNYQENNKLNQAQWRNTNKLLNQGWMGIKTGKTISAGSCLASYKQNALIIVLNSDGSDKRFQDTLKIYDNFLIWKRQQCQN